MSTNLYVNADLILGKLAAAGNLDGSKHITAIITYEKTAADNDGSVLRFCKALNPNIILTNVRICQDALSGATSCNVGFYQPLNADGSGGAIIGTGDQLAAAVSLASARVSGSELSLMTAVDAANRGKRIYELCGHTAVTKLAAYDLAITGGTFGTATGTMTLLVDMIQG